MKVMINKLTWGSIEVQVGDEVVSFRDCKVWPDGAESWNWTDTDTHHSPGIQPADVEGLLKRGIETLIMSRGRMLRLNVCPETIEFLKKSGVDYYFEETSKAVIIFNRLASKGLKVGGLFHTTC